jgi:hypothetical protein
MTGFSPYAFQLRLSDYPRIATVEKNIVSLQPAFQRWLEAQAIRNEDWRYELCRDGSQSHCLFIVFMRREDAALFKTFWL